MAEEGIASTHLSVSVGPPARGLIESGPAGFERRFEAIRGLGKSRAAPLRQEPPFR